MPNPSDMYSAPPERHPSETPSSWQSVEGGYPPPQYPPQPPYPGFAVPPTVHRLKNGLGIASLAVAVAGLVTALSVFGGVALGVVAVVLGFLGRGRVKRNEADNGPIATAGIVLGALAVVAGIVCIFIWAGLWKNLGGGDYIQCLQKAGSDRASQQQCADQFGKHVEDKLGVTVSPDAPAG